MKFFTLCKNRPTPIVRPKQPLMQALEPRRLMSLTAAPDFAPDAEAPAPIVHSFGFENLLPPPPVGGPSPFAQISIFSTVAAGTTGTQTQLARADSQAAPITATATDNTAVPTPAPVADNSLSALYATLNNSTVAAIDAADAAVAKPSFTSTAIPAATNVVQNPNLSTGNAPMEIVIAEKTESASAPNAAAIETTQSPLALPAPTVLGSASAGTTGEIVPQASFAHTLETELQSVSSLAREMVSQMGRDLAIELAHIEAAADTAMIEQLKAWDGWGIAAVAGAAITAAAYLQSESKSDPAKPKSVFSSQMIEPSGA